MTARCSLFLPLIAVAAPAHAAAPIVDLPAGRLGDAVLALGRQTGISIAVSDPSLWERRVPALRAQMTPRRALDTLARMAGAEVRAAGARGWRLVAAKPKRRPPAPRYVAPKSEPVAAAASEDVIVTASKRNVPLLDYAGEVSLIDGDEIQFGGAGGTQSIVSRLASVSSTHLGAGRNKLFIRGIADSSFTGPTQSTVGQYLGDLRLSYNAPDPDLRLYDLASVEVLEGPQGTLYGAGSLGGIIRLTPRPPEAGQTFGWLQGGGSYTQHGSFGGDLAAMLNLPVVDDRIAFRAVGYGITEGGYIDNPLRRKSDVNRTEISGGRANLRVKLDDRWSIDVSGIGQRTHGDDSQYADKDGERLTRSSPVEEGFSASYLLGQLVVSADWDSLHFRSSTGLIRQRVFERYDATVPTGIVLPGTGRIDTPVAAGAVLSNGQQRWFMQRNTTDLLTSEARLWRPVDDGVGWVVGGSFTANRTRLERTLGSAAGTLPATGVSNSIDETTLYGEASLEPASGVIVSGGGRVSFASLSGAAETPFIVTPLDAMVTAPRHETSFLPSAAVVGRIKPWLSVYARFQQGFRPGGLAIEGGTVRQFRNDHVATFETGLRYGQAHRDPLDFDLNLSHTRWDGIQADFIDRSGLPSTANIGDGRIWTLSATAGWRPLPGLRIDAGATINESKVVNPVPELILLIAPTGSIPLSLPSSRVPNVARFAARAGIDYVRPLAGDTTLHVNGFARYVGKSRLGVGPVLGEEQGNYLDTGVNARIGREPFGVTLGVTNLTDSVGNRFAFGTPFSTGRNQITPLRPRTIRIGIDAAF